MSLMTTIRCRAVQVFVRTGRRLRRGRKQTLETGTGAVFGLGQFMRDRRLRTPLVVVGAGEAISRGKLLHALETDDISYALFEDMPPVPTVEDGERIAQAFFSQSCDSLIALGDGTVVDITKAAAALCGYRGRSMLGLVGKKLNRRSIPPVIAVPTVAGTGAESRTMAVIRDGRQNRFSLEGEGLLPVLAMLDPELTADAPRDKTADAGLDGLCWAIEAFLAAPHGDGRTRTMAAEAVERLLASLESCWNSGGTVRERNDILAASRLAGRAASAVGGGYVRAFVRAVQTVCGTELREACGVLLPAILEKYGNYAADGLAQLAVLADVQESGSRAERAEAVIGRIRALTFRLGLPDEFEGVTAEQAAEIADLAAAAANPRWISPVVWTAEQCHNIILSVCARMD